MSGFNIDNPDYIPYSNRYRWAEYPKEISILSMLDISYILIQAFCKDIGIATYEEFRIILSILIYSILAIVIYRYCVNFNLFFIIYTLAYLPLDLIQIRNAFAFVVLLPFLLLLNRPSIKNSVKYLIGVVTAFTIHFSIITFTIFGFIGLKSKISKVIFIFLTLTALIVLFPFISDIMNSAAATDRVASYSRPSVLGGLFMSSIIITNYLIMAFALQDKNRYLNLSETTTMSLCVTHQFIRSVNFLLLFLIPLILMNGTALRVFRFISLVNIIYIINLIYNSRHHRDRLLVYYVILILYALFFGIYFVYRDDTVVNSIFMNSLFV